MLILKVISNKIRTEYFSFLRSLYRSKLRAIFSSDESIVANNCLGSRISQDLGYKYNSPFVGLFIPYPDYITLLKNLNEVKNATMTFRDGGNYPIGMLHLREREITVHFLHYHSEEEAADKWQRRIARMDMDKLAIIGMEADGCTRQDIADFLHLPYKKKIFLSKDSYGLEDSNLHVVDFMNSPKYTNGYEYAHKFYPGIIRNFKRFI